MVGRQDYCSITAVLERRQALKYAEGAPNPAQFRGGASPEYGDALSLVVAPGPGCHERAANSSIKRYQPWQRDVRIKSHHRHYRHWLGNTANTRS